MAGRRSLLNLIFSIIALIAVGFVAGYYARVPLERTASRLKASITSARLQKYLAAKYLGKPAADIGSLRLDGSPFRLSEEKGKVVLLFFWASWCPYSRNALPRIQDIYRRYADRDDFEIVGVSLDRDRTVLNDFAVAHDIRWVNLYENGSAWNSAYAHAYEVKTIPSRWVIDRDLIISGADLGPAETEDLLSVLLENRHRAVDAGSSPSGGAVVDGGGCTAQYP
jgi:thiol-disulfide isomerase/thioredoxin